MTDGRKNLRRKLKFIVIFVVICAIVIEWVVYVMCPWLLWPHFPQVSSEAVKILIVADPQLLGDQFTGRDIGLISQWDADRFIQKTFTLAFNFFKPDVTLFLGDLLDEGVIASDKEYSKYVKRFLKVFNSQDFNKAILLPGDNDIGGEGSEPSTEHIYRFDKHFKSDVLVPCKFLEFIKINYMTKSSSYISVPHISPGTIRIILSHIPITPSYNSFISKVLHHIQPHVILSAHEHISVHLVAERETGVQLNMFPSFADSGIQKMNFSDNMLHEIMIPTCSYRMGVNKMGYGALVIEPNGAALYTIFWLPERIAFLYVYIGLCIFVALILMSSPLWTVVNAMTAKPVKTSHRYNLLQDKHI